MTRSAMRMMGLALFLLAATAIAAGCQPTPVLTEPHVADHIGWSPPRGAVPAKGTALYIESTPGSYLGLGRSYLFTRRDAHFVNPDAPNGDPTSGPRGLNLFVEGVTDWHFALREPGPRLTTGYWTHVPDEPAGPGVGFTTDGNGQGCTGTAAFEINDLSYTTTGAISSLALRFKYTCGGPNPSTVHGYYRYIASDLSVPPLPTAAGNLPWYPPANAIPATGNYFYVDSGVPTPTAGTNGVATGANVRAVATHPATDVPPNLGPRFGPSVHLEADNSSDPTQPWTIWLSGTYTQRDVTVGTYAHATAVPQDPGADWVLYNVGGDQCHGVLSGAFAIDEAVYTSDGTLTSLTARLRIHCGSRVVHAAFHWSSP